jgi:hypothetical protein
VKECSRSTLSDVEGSRQHIIEQEKQIAIVYTPYEFIYFKIHVGREERSLDDS